MTMQATAILETAMGPADLIRRRLLRALGPVSARLAADREARVATMGCLSIAFAFACAVVAPLFMLALGPIVFGVPHLLADVRYLWVRPGHARRPIAWIAIGGPMLAGLVTGRLVAGLLAAAGAVAIARADWPRRIATFGGALVLLGLAIRARSLGDLLFAHLHNFIAVALFWAWRPRITKLHWLPIGLFAILSAAILGGAFDGLHADFGAHASSLARGVHGPFASRLVLAFCFAQSVHYAVWIRLVPEEDRPRATPRTFAASTRELVRDMGLAPVLVTIALALGLAVWALVDLTAARDGYLRFAAFHGQLELAAVALLLAGHRSSAS